MTEIRRAEMKDSDSTMIVDNVLPKSWKCPHCGKRQKMNPYGDETLIEFGNHIQHCGNCGYLHIWELKLTDNFKQQVIGMLLGGDTE